MQLQVNGVIVRNSYDFFYTESWSYWKYSEMISYLPYFYIDMVLVLNNVPPFFPNLESVKCPLRSRIFLPPTNDTAPQPHKEQQKHHLHHLITPSPGKSSPPAPLPGSSDSTLAAPSAGEPGLSARTLALGRFFASARRGGWLVAIFLRWLVVSAVAGPGGGFEPIRRIAAMSAVACAGFFVLVRASHPSVSRSYSLFAV
jgi:hypothetical protein